MKRPLKTLNKLTLITLTSVWLVGCGGSDSVVQALQDAGEIVSDTNKTIQTPATEGNVTTSETNTTQPETNATTSLVEFKTSGSIDLSDFLFKKTAGFKNYSLKTYTGDANLSDTVYGDIYQSSFYQEETRINVDQITLLVDGIIDTTNTILTDRIQVEEANTSIAMIEFARYADLGDYVAAFEQEDLNITCRLSDMNKTVGVYPNLIEISCQDVTGLAQGKSYYSNVLGNVLSVNSICMFENNCTNVVTQLMVLN